MTLSSNGNIRCKLYAEVKWMWMLSLNRSKYSTKRVRENKSVVVVMKTFHWRDEYNKKGVLCWLVDSLCSTLNYSFNSSPKSLRSNTHSAETVRRSWNWIGREVEISEPMTDLVFTFPQLFVDHGFTSLETNSARLLVVAITNSP